MRQGCLHGLVLPSEGGKRGSLMRPRGMRSKWVRLRPWYYAERRQPTRAAEMSEALLREERQVRRPDGCDTAGSPEGAAEVRRLP